MKKFGLFATLMLITALTVSAQFNNNRRWKEPRRGTPSLSAGIMLSAPQTEFDRVYGKVMFGYYGMMMINVGNSPFELGAKASFMTMDADREDIYLYAGTTLDGDEVYEDGRLKATSTARNYSGVARLEPLRGRVQIYGDLMAGFTAFGLHTKVTADNYGRDDVIERDRVFHNSAMTYGWGAGLKIEATKGLMIEGRFENLRGNRATFINPETVVIGDEGQVSFETLESTTDVYNFHLGVSFEF